MICEALGRKAHIWRVPKGLMNGVAKLGGWMHLPLNPLVNYHFNVGLSA